jgi:hypothetical protein
MTTNFRGKDVSVRLDNPPSGSQIVDFKDFNWANPRYEDEFMQERVKEQFQEQILKYQTIAPDVHYHAFSKLKCNTWGSR